MEMFKAKLSMVNLEGEGDNARVRARFSVPREEGVIGDFIVPPDHPFLSGLKVGKLYRIKVRVYRFSQSLMLSNLASVNVLLRGFSEFRQRQYLES